MSTALASLQQRFVAALDGEGEVWPGIEVYRATARANVDGALAHTYPVVRRLVGDAFFFEAARSYAIAHPSASGDLDEHGANFASFLRGYPHAVRLAYLPGVARLEWACHESARAADAAGFDFTALAAIDAAAFTRTRFTLHPSVRLVRSRHPVASIWHANQPGRDGVPDTVEGAQWAVVSRASAGVRVEAIAAARWQFLAALGNGATLGEATASLDEPGARDVLETGLARCVGGGLIAGFDISAPA